MGMFVEVNPYNPDDRIINQVILTLQKGGVIIYPTDSVYGIGCDISHPKAVEKICKIRGLDVSKTNLTFICQNISQIQQYTKSIPNNFFKIIKKNTPGPFTFILPAQQKISKSFKNKRKTIGVRVIDNEIVENILCGLRRPLLSLSLKENETDDYITDPYEIYEEFQKQVDFVIDGGIGNHEPSTVVDMSNNEIEIIRQGSGDLIL